MNKILNTLFNLKEGEDQKKRTLENVKNNISFSGANLWILLCAIIVASVGLNVNSTAVVIGAMLISPLMGPIIASGFALGIYDFELLKNSLRNLLIATIGGLVVSTLYFYVSPFKEAQPELLSRTAPNIYDILIAFFCGLVGVISVTRVEKGNPIPGVAIATALMPPLCTAGYGLATGNLKFFFGAFFLYSINCVFICIATYIIVKFLKYPPKVHVNDKNQKQIKYIITSIVIIMLLPSLYFAYSLFARQKYKLSVDTFIEKEFIEKGNTIIYKKTDYKSSPKSVELAFLSKHFSKNEIDSLKNKLNSYGISDTKLIIKQDSTDNIQNLKNSILNEIKDKEIVVDETAEKIKGLEKKIAENTFDNKEILKEAKILFPSLESLSLGNHAFYYPQDSILSTTILIYQSKKALKKDDVLKLENWIKQRLSIEHLEIYKK